MVVLVVLYLLLLIIALVYGFSSIYGFDIYVEVNNFSSPYYCFGITFFKEEDMNIERFVLGFVFINLVFVFYKVEE